MTVAERMSFSGHETFPFRYAWLKKAVDAVARDGCAFHADDAPVRLGVGKNMVASIRHWGVVTGMLEEAPGRCGGRVRQLQATALGWSLLGDEGWDPFLEDPGTLWLLHWQIASRPAGATTWWWVFNQFPATVFTRGELLDALQALVSQWGAARVTGATLKRDLDVFLRTYAPRVRRNSVLEDTLDCPLAELGVIRASRRDQTYALVRGDHDTLPDEIFAWALAQHLERRPAGAQTVRLEELAFGAGAPGRVFCLDEPGLLGRLDRIEALTEGGVVFDETAGLKQAYVREAPDPARLLHLYYDPRSAEDRVRWPSRQRAS